MGSCLHILSFITPNNNIYIIDIWKYLYTIDYFIFGVFKASSSEYPRKYKVF